MGNVKPIPEAYHSITPYLFIRDAAKAIEFYKTALGATEIMSMPGPDGKVMHAELKIGNSVIMISDENPKMGALGPQAVGGTPVMLYLYVPDVDAVMKKATDAGAKLTQPVKDQFYGDRSGAFTDPFGHKWWVSTHVEDVSPEELKKRAATAMSQTAGG